MDRIHTLRAIAESASRDKRTAQTWYTQAKAEHGELGELISGTRCFNDAERDILLSYAGADRPTATPPEPSSRVNVETGNHQIVLQPLDLPQTFTLEGLRTSEAISFDDPLAVAAQFLTAADGLIGAMGSDIQARQQRLTQTRQAKDAIATKKQQLELEARLYRLQTQQLDGDLSSETAELQKQLAELQKLGKPTDLATAEQA